MMRLIPALCWVMAVLWCLAIAVIAIHKGALHIKSTISKTRFLTIGQVVAQMISVVLACVPYGCYPAIVEHLSNQVDMWYSKVSIPSAIYMGIMLLADIVLLIMQAHLADVSHAGNIADKNVAD
ncbi:hypothetical protein GA0061078_0369 [Bifidobacterium bohemicum]|uniref:Uncharacterized protein n=1 Tax=Bifidobacterium bohemicum DSM 22767 TaxID=1437606 RepID=A0A086ZJB7_9BIFI|nr:hypothetical protein [Bifidobacterium bohemicum]KFI46617.1 hypothetical protein BBOH_0089 [Bifidobacterium bohemicum DSM 22767]SCB76885.1 hypothetical protein GA0061078_0369 [Bifidobacterium bohemicum]